MRRKTEEALSKISQEETTVWDLWHTDNAQLKEFGFVLEGVCGVYERGLRGVLEAVESDFYYFKKAVSTDYRSEGAFKNAFDEFFKFLEASAPFLCVPESRKRIVDGVLRWQRGEY